MDAGGIAMHGAIAEAKHKFVWNEFEQPTGWPKGENQGRFS